MLGEPLWYWAVYALAIVVVITVAATWEDRP
jgi:hypothetical protein